MLPEETRLAAFNSAVAAVRDKVLNIESVSDLFALAAQVADFALTGSYDTRQLLGAYQGAPIPFDPTAGLPPISPAPANDPPDASAAQGPDPSQP